MKKQRSKVDFSNHVVTITDTEGLLVHDFGVPGSSCFRIKFINTNGIMAVTGDCGNYIFCREFHPGEDSEGVSDGYWEEKLRNSSGQSGMEFSEELTRERILSELKEDDLDEDESIYLHQLLHKLNDYEHEFHYSEFAYETSTGRYEDGEYVPYEHDYKYQLKIVFDAFDIICGKIKID